MTNTELSNGSMRFTSQEGEGSTRITKGRIVGSIWKYFSETKCLFRVVVNIKIIFILHKNNMILIVNHTNSNTFFTSLFLKFD